MSTRALLALVLAFAIVAGAGYGLGRIDNSSTVAAQESVETWNSTMIWRPTLEEVGLGLAEIVNQIDARCDVDVDPVQATTPDTPEGTVYAFAVTWSC